MMVPDSNFEQFNIYMAKKVSTDQVRYLFLLVISSTENAVIGNDRALGKTKIRVVPKEISPPLKKVRPL